MEESFEIDLKKQMISQNEKNESMGTITSDYKNKNY